MKKDYATVGVRFIYGPADSRMYKVYTYRVKKRAKVFLGQAVVVPTMVGQRVAVIVEIHDTPQDTGAFNYLWITQKVTEL